MLNRRHTLPAEVGANFADKRCSPRSSVFFSLVAKHKRFDEAYSMIRLKVATAAIEVFAVVATRSFVGL
jgi:hypothetical protein